MIFRASGQSRSFDQYKTALSESKLGSEFAEECRAEATANGRDATELLRNLRLPAALAERPRQRSVDSPMRL
jgi:hypothetical protein